MSEQNQDRVTVKLDPEHAWNLAQLCKRAFFERVLPFAQDEVEARMMLQGIYELRRELAKAGYEPR